MIIFSSLRKPAVSAVKIRVYSRWYAYWQIVPRPWCDDGKCAAMHPRFIVEWVSVVLETWKNGGDDLGRRRLGVRRMFSEGHESRLLWKKINYSEHVDSFMVSYVRGYSHLRNYTGYRLNQTYQTSLALLLDTRIFSYFCNTLNYLTTVTSYVTRIFISLSTLSPIKVLSFSHHLTCTVALCTAVCTPTPLSLVLSFIVYSSLKLW